MSQYYPGDKNNQLTINCVMDNIQLSDFLNFKIMFCISKITFFLLPLIIMWVFSYYSGVMALLRPLLLDVVPNIQQTAALALGRLANYNDDLAEAVVKGDILPQLVYSLAEQNVRHKQS